MAKKQEDRPAPMPDKILVGDKVRLNERKRAPYAAAYGPWVGDKVWVVKSEDFISGRRRLIVDGTPTVIWNNDAKLAWTPQSKERREHLTALGVRLP